jgi:hypothetical protein
MSAGKMATPEVRSSWSAAIRASFSGSLAPFGNFPTGVGEPKRSKKFAQKSTPVRLKKTGQ